MHTSTVTLKKGDQFGGGGGEEVRIKYVNNKINTLLSQ